MIMEKVLNIEALKFLNGFNYWMDLKNKKDHLIFVKHKFTKLDFLRIENYILSWELKQLEEHFNFTLKKEDKDWNSFNIFFHNFKY